MRRMLTFLLVLCLAVSLVGCSDYMDETEDNPFDSIADYYQSDNETAEISIDEFTLPYYKGESLNPYICKDGVQLTLSSLIYEGLYALDASFCTMDMLASSYSYKDCIYTIQLKDGIRFSDGSTLRAEDVVVSLNMARTTGRYVSRLSIISEIVAKGKSVEITLLEDNANFISLLNIPIVKSGTEDKTIPTGTGPFVLYENGGNPILIANSFYWQEKDFPLDEIKLYECKNEENAYYAFSSNNIQLLTKDLIGNESNSLTFGTGSYYGIDTTILIYLGINTSRTYFEDAALRQALSLGLNRSNLVSTCLLGHGVPSQFPISPCSDLYPANYEDAYSLSAYENALKDVGFDDDIESTFLLLVNEENSFKVALANAVAESLSKCGFHIEVETLPFAEFQNQLVQGNFDLFIGETKLTTDWDLSALIGSEGMLNFGYYLNMNMDTKINRMKACSQVENGIIVQDFYAYFKEEMPFVPICFKQASLLVSSNIIEDVSPTPDNPFYGFENWTIHLTNQ